MAAFYARYVPPTKTGQLDLQEQGSFKRKHNGLHNHEATTKRRRTDDKNDPDTITANGSQELNERGQSKKPRSSLNKRSILGGQSKSGEEASTGEDVLAKYSLKSAAGQLNGAKAFGRKAVNGASEGRVEEGHLVEPATLGQATKKLKKSKKGRTSQDAIDPAVEPDVEVPNNQKHVSIRSKFETSKANARIDAGSKRDENLQGKNDEDEHGSTQGEPRETSLHGLEPLPQPMQIEMPGEIPTYSTLPSWMAKPFRVPASVRMRFQELAIDKQLLQNLEAKGLETAFAVQSVVLPLLMKGTAQHRGDLCISAATGSGKTLAYVLPMIEALKHLLGTKLRGLIVVPTRELVNQAREVCEYCAAGTSLRIATALGSKALKDEQDNIIEQHMIYDPERYRVEQEKPIDWTKFGLEDLLLESEEDVRVPNYVKKYSSKVDILICTPGRLVDHLRSTPGFTLDDVQWVVIDEADRLLNESFQEWVEVVMPALTSEAATSKRDGLLREMRLEVPERKIQKVILSATMTQDISKLNSLGLRNPKLVVVGDAPKSKVSGADEVVGQTDEPIPQANGTFALPPTLLESAISVGDESQKPLYLLKLLDMHILKPAIAKQGLVRSAQKDLLTTHQDASDDSSDDSSSDSSLSSDSDSSSNSDSASPSISQPITYTGSSHSPINLRGPSSQTALIFTRTSESASRLARLLALLSPDLSTKIASLTKSSNSASARKTLSQFRQGKIVLLIATDRASRGLDLPGLAHVVSYDVPTSATTYIHRVGRTARAGKEGCAWTLVSHREARWFWREIGKGLEGTGEVKIDRSAKVKRFNLEVGDDEEVVKRYEDALGKLGEEVRGD